MKNKLLVCILFLSLPLGATHLRCGYIRVEAISTVPRVCRITVTVFTQDGSTVLFGGNQDPLFFGDGTSFFIPETQPVARPDLGTNVGMARYSILHTYPSSGHYTIRYQEPMRNAGILNMDNSVATPFYLETNFTVDPAFGLFSTPEFLVDPFFAAQLGSELSISLGAFYGESEYDIQYELTTPHQAVNYKLPVNFKINPFNGVITWDTKFLDQYVAGEYLFAAKVHLFKKIGDAMLRVCTVTRDFQVVLTGDGVAGKISFNKELDENNRIYVPENDVAQIKIFYEVTTPTGLSAFSELLENEEASSFTTYDSSTNENIKVGILTLTNHASIIRDTPYQITVRGMDGNFGSDVNYLFYTRDIHPELITGAEDDLASVELFPNPVKDYVSISLPENQPATVKIYNQTGKLVSESFIEGKTSIDLRSFPSGFYYCRIQSGNQLKLVKL